jgi:hypothetical protein
MVVKKLTPSAATRKQELTSAWVFRRALKENKKYKKVEDVWTDEKFLKEVMGKNGIYPEIIDSPDWLETFFLQQKKFLEEFSDAKFTEFTREYGFMRYISNFVKTQYGISKKDSWDPADIWCIQNEKKVISDIEKEANEGSLDTVEQLNAYLKTLFEERKVVGISLKKVSKGQVSYKEFNINGKKFKSSKKPNYDVSEVNIDFFWDKNKSQFKGNYIAIKFKIIEDKKEEAYNFNIRSQSLNHFRNLVFAPVSITHSAAQEGAVPNPLLIKKLAEFGITNFKNDWKQYPQKGSDFLKNEEKYSKMFSAVNSKRFINTGIKSSEEFIESMKKVYLSKIENYLHIANSKLMQLTFVHEISKLSKKDMDKLITDMLFLAQKSGEGFGPFGKIY